MSLLAQALSFAAGLAVRSTVVFVATGVALFALRRAGAATRHRVGTIGLAAALALPVLSLTLPRVKIAVLAPLASGAPALAAVWPGVLLGLWAAGALAVAARLAVGWARVRRLSRNASVLWDAEWISERDAAARRLALDRNVELKESPGVPVAITSGWRRPFLLIGEAARHWALERRRVVLLHELAHVKRSDWPALLVAELAVAVYWFHPLALWLGRRVRREAEQACDELVVATGTKPSVYAGHLLGIFRSLGAAPAPAAAALAIARPGHFEARLRAILDPRGAIGAPDAGRSRLAVAGLVAASAAAAVLAPCDARNFPLASVAPAGASSHQTCAQAARKIERTAVRTEERRQTVEERRTEPAAPETDLPALPEPGMSLPAMWRVDAKEAPRAAGFVLASQKHRSGRDGSDWYDRGMNLHHRRRYEEAIQAFKNAIEDGYREDASSYNIACGYALLGDKDKAFEWLHKAMEEGFDVAAYLHDDDLDALHGDPRWAELRKAARESSSDKGESRAVAARYERLVAKAPKSGEPWFDIGRELLRVDRYDLAARAFQASADRNYRVGTSLYNEACALSLDDKKDAALDMLRRALDAGFDQPDMFDKDDDLDNVRGDPRFAALANEAEELSLPGYGVGPWSWGSRSSRARWRDAAKRFQTYTEKHPQSGRAWYNLGYSLLAGDRADDAAPAFKKALDLGYRKPDTLYNLACTYARLDQKDAAFDWLFKALDAGFDEQWTLRHDDDLDNLRGDSRYRKAVEIARNRDRGSEKD